MFRLLILASLIGSGCLSHPLGSDWENLPPARKEQKCLQLIERTVANRCELSSGRDSVKINEVVYLDREVVVFHPLDKPHPLYILFLRDITMVDGYCHMEFPGQPETVRFYLSSNCPSLKSAPVDVPLLHHAYLGRAVMELPYRPRGIRKQLQAAIDYLHTLARRRGISAKLRKLIGDWDQSGHRLELEQKVYAILQQQSR